MIVLATADFELYHDVVDLLERRDATFETVEPTDSLPAAADVVLVDAGTPVADAARATDVPVVEVGDGKPRELVAAAFAHLGHGTGRTVVGVDPGERPGVAVLRGRTVVAASQVPLADVPERVAAAVADAPDPLVRVGDGAPAAGRRIVDDLEDLEDDDLTVELVDETGTTPTLGPGARGMSDVLAAVNVALRPGDATEERDHSVTDGDVRAIQRRSRERADDDRTIDASLARRVARGELTVPEALDEHRRTLGEDEDEGEDENGEKDDSGNEDGRSESER